MKLTTKEIIEELRGEMMYQTSYRGLRQAIEALKPAKKIRS